MSVTLITPVLTRAQFELNPGFKADAGGGLPADLHLHHFLTRKEGANEAVVALRLQVNQREETRLEGAPFWLEVEYTAKIIWSEDVAPEEIDSYLYVNVPAVLIGYIRPVVAGMTSISPMPTYTLPFINVNGLFSAKDEATAL